MKLSYACRVIKLGGSVVTVKDKPMSVRHDIIKYLSSELASFLNEHPNVRLLLIHGGGSFGHFSIKKCLSSVGAIDVKCFSHTSYMMMLLNTYLVNELIEAGLTPVSIPPHTIFWKEGGKLKYELGLLKEYLAKGFTPVLYGDVIISDNVFEVLSGDTIAWVLAKELDVNEIVFVTDVDGLFDKDPKVHSDAKFIETLRAEELKDLKFSTSDYDVTGSMMLKLTEGLKYGVKDVRVRIVNGLVKGNVYKVLVGSSTVGTVVEY
ncbi:MAG: isopentenyl phosphate kinase [Sulfolobales archaeon]|nr:isopentenyl phosphate kinase [Sulfolobales archaeon]MCX8186800.1 isopentenyl phosphate kinase [Sulfolobales archaeon]MDW7969867.1 isopentenyl phosphate kinase [Sulfolobales archaeon]